MRQHLIDLYKIQKIDLSIRDDEQQLQLLPMPLTAKEQLLAAKKVELQRLMTEREGAIAAARALQSTIETERDKVRKWEARLTDIRNQREFQALQRETEGQKRATKDSESKLQELHRNQEELQRRIDDLVVQTGDEESACKQERGSIAALMQQLDAAIAAKRKSREDLVPQVPKALFRKYDSIRAKRLGMGLSIVAQGCCVGCNMRLPPQLYNTLQRGEDILQCPSCFRIIFWDQMLQDSGSEQTQDN